MSKLFLDQTALVLLDYQRMQIGVLPEQNRIALEHRLKVLIKIAAAVQIPIVISTNLEGGALGRSIQVVQDHAKGPHENRIQRAGAFNPFDDPAFGSAIGNLGRRTLLIAGFPTDVPVTLASITATEMGFNVHALVDCCESPSETAHNVAIDRMRHAGVTPNGSISALAEMVRDLASPPGIEMMKIVAEEMIFAVDGPVA
ncbi:MAG: isochorismatase family protein [Pseudomonadota bacterium]